MPPNIPSAVIGAENSTVSVFIVATIWTVTECLAGTSTVTEFVSLSLFELVALFPAVADTLTVVENETTSMLNPAVKLIPAVTDDETVVESDQLPVMESVVCTGLSSSFLGARGR